jgi:cell division protein FtsB
MNVNLGIWSKLTKVVIALVVIAILLLIGMCYLPLIHQQLQQEEDKNKHLQTQIDALLHDPKTVERLTREKLGYAKPDETVIRFETPATNSQSGQ